MKIKCKSIIKYVILTITSLLLLGILFANIDYSRIKKDKPPILSIRVGEDKRTRTDIYYGLGYIVLKCPKGDENMKYENKYELYFLDNRHYCNTTYYVDVEAQ